MNLDFWTLNSFLVHQIIGKRVLGRVLTVYESCPSSVQRVFELCPSQKIIFFKLDT